MLPRQTPSPLAEPKEKVARRRGRRIFIVKGHDTTVQPDMWPGDELWADDLTLLGYVTESGDFVSNSDAGVN